MAFHTLASLEEAFLESPPNGLCRLLLRAPQGGWPGSLVAVAWAFCWPLCWLSCLPVQGHREGTNTDLTLPVLCSALRGSPPSGPYWPLHPPSSEAPLNNCPSACLPIRPRLWASVHAVPFLSLSSDNFCLGITLPSQDARGLHPGVGHGGERAAVATSPGLSSLCHFQLCDLR